MDIDLGPEGGKTGVHHQPWDTRFARLRFALKKNARVLVIGGVVVAGLVGGAVFWRHHQGKPKGSVTTAPHAAATHAPVVHKKAAAPPPSKSEALRNAGMGFYKAKDYDRAVDNFKDAMSEDPNDSEAVYWLAESYRGLKKDSKACKYFGKYLEKVPAGHHATAARAEIKKCD